MNHNTQPLLAAIVRLQHELAEIPPRLDVIRDNATIKHKRALQAALETAKHDFITAEIAAYLAGEDARPVALPEGPLTSAEAMAVVFEFADRSGLLPFPRSSTEPLPALLPFPRPSTEPLPAPNTTRRAFVPGGEYLP